MAYPSLAAKEEKIRNQNVAAAELTAENAVEEDGAPKDLSLLKCCTDFRLCWLSMIAASIILTATFAYSAIVQYNDADSVASYATFYAFHAVLPFSIVLQQTLGRWRGCCDRGAKRLFWAAAGALACWSVALIVIPAAKLPLIERGGPEVGGDNDGATESEELVYEIAGAALGLLSTIYHVVWIQVSGASSAGGGLDE